MAKFGGRLVVVLGEILETGKRVQDSAVPRDFNEINTSIYEDTGGMRHDSPTEC